MANFGKNRSAVFAAILIAWALVSCAMGALGLGIKGSAHDFTSYPWWPSDSLCLTCHSAQATFNHELSTATYTVSNSPTLDATDLGQPGGTSANCLSCHDGTVPLDSFGGHEGSTYMTGPAVFATDLRHHHPVSFTYNAALAVIDGRLHNPTTTPSGLGGTIAQDMLSDDSKIECDTCHDQHGYSGLPSFLVKSIESAALCHTCHTSEPVANGHHLPGRESPWNNCTICHGDDLTGGQGLSCMACHNDFVPPLPPAPGHHVPNRDDPYGAGNCTMCHGADLGGDLGPSCFNCHGQMWPEPDFAPLAEANGPYAAEVGAAIRFDGSGSVDPDGTVVAYDWDFGDGSSSTGASPTHAYAAAGVYTVGLSVTDDSGLTDTDTAVVDVSAPANLSPAADAGGPYTGIAGRTVQFDASGTTDSEGDRLSYQWGFGDGTPLSSSGQSPTITHTYVQAGSYTVQLAVSDGVNDPVVTEVAVEIAEDTEPPGDDSWEVKIPYLLVNLTVSFEKLVGQILLVETTHPGGEVDFGLGMELDGVIFWMDVSGAIFFGNIDRTAATMRGVVFDYNGAGSIWFAEPL